MIGLFAAAALLAATTSTACDDGEIGTPLSVELMGPGTGVVGHELSVVYSVSGRSLTGIIFEWGDGMVDSLATAGAQSAEGSRPHTYADPGVFSVRAVVEDAVEGVASAAVEINIEQRQNQ